MSRLITDDHASIKRVPVYMKKKRTELKLSNPPGAPIYPLLSAQVNGPLTVSFGSAKIPRSVLILAYIPGIIKNHTSAIITIFKHATAIFFPLLRHLPFQLRWNQNSTVTPQVNHDSKSAAEMLRRELNTGIALARIQTTTQNKVTEKIQTAHSVFWPMWLIATEARRPRGGRS